MKAQTERNSKMVAERARGASFRDLAKKYGISAPRAHQICMRELRRQQREGKF
jgi:Mor family transcriptional regulator